MSEREKEREKERKRERERERERKRERERERKRERKREREYVCPLCHIGTSISRDSDNDTSLGNVKIEVLRSLLQKHLWYQI